MNLPSLNNSIRILSSKKGFTLIEVMIALFILVMIGTTTSKAVIDAAKLKEVLKDETEFASEFRTSFGFLERDLNQVFNPRWFLDANLKPLDPYNQTPTPPAAPGSTNARPTPAPMSVDELNRRTKGTAFQSYEYWGPLLDSTGIRASRFKGKETEMSFVVASHTRIYQQKKESIYAKIKYEIVKQPPNSNLTKEQNDKASQLFALIKTENTHAFELEEPKDVNYINNYVILNNIKSFKFHYYKKDDKEAKREWDSDSQDLKGVFPTAVEVEVSMVGPKERTLDAKLLFYLETPNEVLPKTY